MSPPTAIVSFGQPDTAFLRLHLEILLMSNCLNHPRSAVPSDVQSDVQSEARAEAFRSLIGAASDRSCSEEWIDSLSYAAGPERELLADAGGVYDVRPLRACEDVEHGAAVEDVPAGGWVS